MSIFINYEKQKTLYNEYHKTWEFRQQETILTGLFTKNSPEELRPYFESIISSSSKFWYPFLSVDMRGYPHPFAEVIKQIIAMSVVLQKKT